ncbi:lysophospholipase catalytic domain-containing protein [Rhexocercosporidium sp. MPI-PUGE-AT-0058]|nr:lysophospholipase catalytic domain-containing protein [Rhexocercosporidium sp. MPI-PUGE-AT-0058]
MKLATSLFASVATISLCEASIVLPREASPEVVAAEALVAPEYALKRALPNSPSGGYAPAVVDCPSERPTIRSAATLSPSEVSWLELRRNNTVDPMISWLTRMNITDFDASSYINRIRNNATALPNIGMAVSGGGYRALMNGAGFIAAADNRTSNSTNKGQIGGLLQATTYLAGLSGGGWLVGSMYTNNFSSVQDLRDRSKDSNVWKFDNSIFKGPDGDGIQLLSTADYYSTIRDEVETKSKAGYNTSITDYWGRALSYQLVNATNGGPAYTFSSIALADNFRSGSIPFPFLVADGRSPGTKIISLNSTVFEFNPFEMGSWDPVLYGFAPTQYLGSNFSAGVVPSSGSCVRGFDQSGFVMGTSSSLFNQFLLQINSTAIPSFLRDIFTNILTDLGQDNNDIAQWKPNPFYAYNNASSISSSLELSLVDGGEDLQNIPLYPLIQPQRAVDVIFAVDSSYDTTYGWPNGTSLVATYERSLNATIENGTAFPSIPDQNTFVNLGLNNRPTFFGCNSSNMTGPAPIVVYIPNAPYITLSNVSTFDPEYNNTQRNLIIQNGYEVATLGNGTLDAQWPTCMACAVLSRSLERTGTTVPSVCNSCFERYCWNGTTDSRALGSNYEPAFKSKEIPFSGASSFGVSMFGVSMFGVMAALVSAVLMA